MTYKIASRAPGLLYRQSLVEMLERISVAQGDSTERRRERIFFRPAFPLREYNRTLKESAAKDYNGPAGKCGVAMVTAV